jgi:RecB family exonuclease
MYTEVSNLTTTSQEVPAGHTAMRLSHSYSSIKLFENCPLRYYRQRITKDVVDEGGEASKHGERIHAFLENRLKGSGLDAEIAQYEPLCLSVEKLARQGELYIEKELVLTDNLTATGWWDADAWLRSKLDVLVIVGGEAVVMDWKTGKRNADQFQMQLFAAQVFKHYPDVQRVKTSLVWLKTMEMDTNTYKRSGVNAIWAEVMKRIQRIRSSLEHDNWPAKPSGLCRYCPCRHDCDYARV